MPPKALTNPSRPVARYRKGKGVALPEDDSSSGDDDNEQSISQQQEKQGESDDDDDEQQRRAHPGGSAKTGGRMAVSIRDVQVDQSGSVLVSGKAEVGRTERERANAQEDESEYETDTDDEPAAAAPKPTYKKPALGPPQSDEESSEYETDTDEDQPAPLFKPVFVFKRNRDTIAEMEKELDPEVIEARRVAELEQRKKESHDLVAESIQRELAMKDVEQVFPDVDDTDGLDPQAEFERWKLRELMRIKRDKEAQYAREKEREEVEARRALPEALRMKEDLERAQKTRDEKKKGQQVFLQKYHHKGAFYADSDILKKHDYTAPTLSTNTAVESLPAVMQKRNFGKAHQTKYTHLAAEDTSRPDAGWSKKPGVSGASNACFNCGGPHMKKDCPQLSQGGGGPSGANGAGDDGWRNRRPEDSTSGRHGGDRYASSSSMRERDDRPPPPDWERGGDKQRERYAAAERRESDRDRSYRRDDSGRDHRGRESEYDRRRDDGRDRERGGTDDRYDHRRRDRSPPYPSSRGPPPPSRRDEEREEKRRRVQ